MNIQFKRSGLRVGGEAATVSSNPIVDTQPSETPPARSRSDVAAAITRSASRGGEIEAGWFAEPMADQPRSQNSAGNGGGEQANDRLKPRAQAPAARTSGRKAGAGETNEALSTKPAASPRQSSRRKAGASDAIVDSLPEPEAHPGDNTGRKVGDEQAKHERRPKPRLPAVQISGASASGDEAIEQTKPATRQPRRRSPNCEVGADQATGAATPMPRLPDPQLSGETRGDESQEPIVTRTSGALIAELVQLGRARRDWMKTRVGIELRAIAICRRFCAGDKDEAKVLWKAVREGTAPEDLLFAVAPLLGPIASLEEQEKRVDRQMTKLAGKHEMAAWAKSIRGFGHAGLAKVIAECGDIGSYRGPACVWKRMGLAVINGARQRRVPGAEALEHGYNAERRSVMWNVGGAVIGGMGKGPRPLVGEDVDVREDLTEYQKLFVRRLRLEAERDPEAHAREPVTNKETGVIKESFSAHAANRAKRYVEKRLLRDLWISWRRAGQATSDTQRGSADSPTQTGATEPAGPTTIRA